MDKFRVSQPRLTPARPRDIRRTVITGTIIGPVIFARGTTTGIGWGVRFSAGALVAIVMILTAIVALGSLTWEPCSGRRPAREAGPF